MADGPTLRLEQLLLQLGSLQLALLVGIHGVLLIVASATVAHGAVALKRTQHST